MCVERDVHKRPTQMKRDLQKRPIYIEKRPKYEMHVCGTRSTQETYTNEKRPIYETY